MGQHLFKLHKWENADVTIQASLTPYQRAYRDGVQAELGENKRLQYSYAVDMLEVLVIEKPGGIKIDINMPNIVMNTRVELVKLELN